MITATITPDDITAGPGIRAGARAGINAMVCRRDTTTWTLETFPSETTTTAMGPSSDSRTSRAAARLLNQVSTSVSSAMTPPDQRSRPFRK